MIKHTRIKYVQWAHDAKDNWKKLSKKHVQRIDLPQPVRSEFDNLDDLNYILSRVNNEFIIDWRMIKCPTLNLGEDQGWYGDFMLCGRPYFFISLKNQAICGADNKWHLTDSYYVYCTGTDDFAMSIRDLPLQKAKEIFYKIKDRISKSQLRELGLKDDC